MIFRSYYSGIHQTGSDVLMLLKLNLANRKWSSGNVMDETKNWEWSFEAVIKGKPFFTNKYIYYTSRRLSRGEGHQTGSDPPELLVGNLANRECCFDADKTKLRQSGGSSWALNEVFTKLEVIFWCWLNWIWQTGSDPQELLTETKVRKPANREWYFKAEKTKFRNPAVIFQDC